MASNAWSFIASGNWLDGTRWSGGAPPVAGDDVFIDQSGPYTVTLNSAATINSLSLDGAGAILAEGAAGSLTVAGAVNMTAGTMALNGVNSLGAFNESGGVLEVYKAAALGAATLALTGGEVTGMATESIGNFLDLGGAGFTIDAATGTSVDFGADGWNLNDAGVPLVKFGSPTRRGTVIWHSTGALIFGGGAYNVEVAGGVLKGADSGFNYLLANDASTNVMAGATLDLNGVDVGVGLLAGAGAIVNSGAAVTLTIHGGAFGGVISGPIAVDIGQTTVLGGANTYTGATTIDSGQKLYLAGAGRIAGAIIANGALFNQVAAGQVTLGAISGGGVLFQTGASTLVLNQVSSFTGGANIFAGTVSIGSGAALGTGAVLVYGAELAASATVTVSNLLTMQSADTIAAATGKILTLTGGGNLFWDGGGAPLTVTFGDGLNKGTVLLAESGASVNPTQTIHIKVASGVLQIGDSQFLHVTEASQDVRIAAGATLDLGGFPLVVSNLTSMGVITNSTASLGVLRTQKTSFIAGTVTGALALVVLQGATTLTGADSATGGTTIAANAALSLGNGGAAGSLAGAIDVEGGLLVWQSGQVALSGAISGAGQVTQFGAGTTTLSGPNTYSGGTNIQHGVLVAANGAALGAGGTIFLTGGELLGSASETLSHDLSTKGSVTLAAAHGATLVLATANDTLGAGLVAFGAAGADGAIVLKVTAGISAGPGTLVEVRAGTLKAGDNFGLTNLLSSDARTTIDAGATLDGAGQNLVFGSLAGAGTLTDTGGRFLSFEAVSTFAGVIAGACNLDIFGAVTLTGAQTFLGKAYIFDAVLTPSGPFKEDVAFSGGGLLVLPVPANFTGRIGGFASGSTIDLRNITKGAAASLSYDTATHVLTVSDGVHTDRLTFLGGYVAGNFKATSDYAGATNISWRVPPPHVIAATGGPGVRDAFVSAMAGFAAPAGGEASLSGAMRHEAAAMLVAPRAKAA